MTHGYSFFFFLYKSPLFLSSPCIILPRLLADDALLGNTKRFLYVCSFLLFDYDSIEDWPPFPRAE